MPLAVLLTGMLIIVSAFGYSFVSTSRGNSTTVVSETSATTTNIVVGSNMMGNAGSMMKYQDGTYVSSVPYQIPYGYVEPMQVTLTVAKDKVVAADVIFKTVNSTSVDYQNLFLNYYKSKVIGVSLDAVSMSRRGGASLTNAAFNKAVNNIKKDATGMMTM